MSILSQLKPKKGSTGYRKRVGRGDGSGLGGTSGKGHKGQKARTGGRVRWGFEGGQTPLMRRAPKFGFNNKDFRNEFEVINLSAISKFSGEVTPETLKKAGLITGRLPVKVLAKGEIKTAVTVKADKFSKAAQAAIEKAGGKVEVLGAK
ncbi:MAG TPA: 50S ribosomal protein L15 [Pseudobdellovibrionaceae bacterium]|jgi:large subunit ribosomal protein L15|nr:50S ribosomal protein L15 [Pseudobdellovibrionaceae bacterium]